MKLKRTIAAMVLVSAFAAPVAAGTFEDAVDAHARGDYAKALRLIRPLANDGNATAQFKPGNAIPSPSSISGSYTPKAEACRTTTFVPTCGSVYRRHRASKERSTP